MQYKVHYLCMVLYGMIVFSDEWMDIIVERKMNEEGDKLDYHPERAFRNE